MANYRLSSHLAKRSPELPALRRRDAGQALCRGRRRDGVEVHLLRIAGVQRRNQVLHLRNGCSLMSFSLLGVVRACGKAALFSYTSFS